MKTRTFVHIGVYVVAFFVFYVGLFLGLQVNTTAGNIGVLMAFVIAAINTWFLGAADRT